MGTKLDPQPVSGTVLPSRGGGGAITLYVRTTGSDSSGNGTSAKPFRTVAHALATIPQVLWNTRYLIDCTGIGQEVLPDGYNFPPFQCGDATVSNASPVYAGYDVEAPITIYALPTVSDTITGVQISSQNANANTGLRTIATTKTWTSNQWKGFFVVGAGTGISAVAPIVSNTTTDLEVATSGSLTAPLSIVSLSANLHNSVGASSKATLTIQNPTSALSFYGIKFSHANSGIFSSLILTGATGSPTTVRLCEIQGLTVNAVDNAVMSAIYFRGANVALTSISGTISRAFYDTVAWQLRDTRSGQLNIQTSIFDGGTSFGDVATGSTLVAGQWAMSNCLLRNIVGDGIIKRSSKKSSVTTVQIGCSGNGITADAPGMLALSGVKGTVAGTNGIYATDGAFVTITGSSTIAGATNEVLINGTAKTHADLVALGAAGFVDTDTLTRVKET